MSSYYHIVKKEILKEKQFLGMDLKIFYYIICIVGIMSLYGFVLFINSYNGINSENNADGLIYSGMAGVCYLVLRFLNRYIISSNWSSACNLCNNKAFGEEPLNYLIQEVEQSIKNIKRFSEWCVGVIVTLVVLITTLILNVYSKIADIILKGLGDKEIKTFSQEVIKQINEQEYNPFSDLFYLFFQLLFLFSSFILFGYFIFSLFSIAKRQVLATLYDIRYALLLDIPDIENS
ncbi:hypothetical protein P0E66_15025 [Enterococcus faecalis]|uniref:hypothetical protein n=1 Tax=Enterococcus faecalis TaxID=1351 RepID=UPI0025B1E140|nr:hypothetical protein [Enterococcus faecalis]MDN3202423.1 hypothetical protein [Enterococcus faecalis]